MQVIQCADYGGPYRGSFVPMLRAVAQEAANRGYRTTLVLSEVARDRAWLADFDGLAEVRFVATGDSRGSSVRAAMRELDAALGQSSTPAVIHTHFATFDIPAALMRLRRRRLRIIWHEHGPVFDDARTRLRNTLRYVSVGRLVSRILCVSSELCAELRTRHAPRRRLQDFPNAIDTRTFAPITASERSAARRALDLPDTARVVLHFAWNWELKGGDLMLAAAGLLASEPDVVLLTVVGDDERAILGGANPNVRALAPTNDVKQLYAAADVFLSASRAEGGLPLAVLEALACGLPVVVTDIPVQDRLLAGLPGAATVAGEPAAVAAGISEMLALEKGGRVEHERLMQARLRSFFALDAWARRLLDLYETVLGPRG